MKSLIIILVMVLSLYVNIYAENPYKQFGCEGKELLTEQEKSGEYIFEIKSNIIDSASDFLYFNVKEGVVAVFSINNDTIKIGKIDPTIVKRWLSTDPLCAQHPEVSPYSSFGNNPIFFIDPDGKDEVYFDWQGNEVNRKPSDEIFKTFVGDDKYWHEAEMPKIIEGKESPEYQQHDYSIAAQTFIFNNCQPEDRPSKGMQLEGGEPIPLDPTLVKAIVMRESQAGQFDGKKHGKKDIMQVNAGDWDPKKMKLGLEKGVTPDPNLSVYAGIRWLYYKGLQAKEEADKKGIVNKVIWRGDDKQSWWNAVILYNASDNKESYLKQVKDYYLNATVPVPANYINGK